MPGMGRFAAGAGRALVLGALTGLNLLALAIGLWSQAPVPQLWLLVSASGLACIVALALAWRRQAQDQGRIQALLLATQQPSPELEPLRAQIRASEARLHEVMDALPAGVAVYDNQDRLVAFNRALATQPPYRSGGKLVGETYETLLRRVVEAGEIPDAPGQEEQWLALRLANRRAHEGPITRHGDDGQWVHLFEQHTPSGYLVMTRLDLAPLVEKGLALERSNEQMLRLSLTDGLTGIANRRQFEMTLQNEWQRCARTQTSLSALLIDIDHFRQYNKRYGHQGGDECLRQVARTLGLCVKRSGELVARHGGEKFAALLPGVDASEARRVAQRCLLEIQNARIPHQDSVGGWLSVSVGVATMVAAPGQPPGAVVQQAEDALARAKTAGRARLEVFA